MISEICEYDGFIQTRSIQPTERLQIQDLAREYGYEIDVYSEHIELSYHGRDHNNIFLEFLKRLAKVIQSSNGEIKCTRENMANGEDVHEIYTIDNGLLYVQEVLLLKGQKKLVH